MDNSAVASLIILPISLRLRPKKGSIVEKIEEVDWIGCFLLMTSATSVLIAISWGGLMFPWSSYHTLVPLILGLAGLAAFVVWEQHFTKQSLVPMSIFANRTAATVYWQSLITGLNM
jgi:ABC-type bacteriocin/lantibiotic exporter with double-glycine peptidase domain